jgi:hypothetical protein
MMHMTTWTYLLKSERGAINSGKDITYFVTKIVVQPHTHPLYVQRCIKEQAESLGLGVKDGFYETMVSAWSEDFDTIIAEREKMIAHYEPHKKEFPMHYYPIVETLKQIKEAKRIVEQGLVVNAEIL